jgi:cobalt-zinc-cadmium efflux system membrane fusion protein
MKLPLKDKFLLAGILLAILLFSALVLSISVERVHADDSDAHSAGEHEGDSHAHAEGEVDVPADMLSQLGLRALTAGSGKLTVTRTLTGRIGPQEDRVAHVMPRYSGVLRSARKRLGDSVTQGEVVAVVENSQTLQPFEVRSQIPGTVVVRHATVGETVTETTTLYEVADYTELYADFFVFPGEYKEVRVGQRVIIRFPERSEPISSVITFLSPVTNPDTQSRFVRTTIPNPNGDHQPGMYITGDVVLEESVAAVVVDASAVRTQDGASIVFVQSGDARFVARPVIVGRRDKDQIEILKGLSAGERYAAGNTFVLLAELGKGEAEHDH